MSFIQPNKYAPAGRQAPHEGMIWIPGGTFTMGSDAHYPEEAPAHRARVEGFWMDRHTVTNREFEWFVMATGYVTLAERPASPEDYPGALAELLAPSSTVFSRPLGPVDMRNHYNWWSYVRGANWRHPGGPQTNIEAIGDHPVVHVAYEDAEAFSRWIGKELPTEAEWEFAARGGLEQAEYPWGDEFNPGGRHMANTWQGNFPYLNTGEDGFEGTAPVESFPPNGYGLYDMAGNVWEWTSDWYAAHRPTQLATIPRGVSREESFDARQPGVKVARKVTKGGSHLCSPNYCRRYRPAARMAQPIDTSISHLGFRCIVRPAR
jgi:formylglycine-generating enzyme required for sulfatase activity